MLTLAEKERRGVWQILAFSDKGRIRGLANADITDKDASKCKKKYIYLNIFKF